MQFLIRSSLGMGLMLLLIFILFGVLQGRNKQTLVVFSIGMLVACLPVCLVLIVKLNIVGITKILCRDNLLMKSLSKVHKIADITTIILPKIDCHSNNESEEINAYYKRAEFGPTLHFCRNGLMNKNIKFVMYTPDETESAVKTISNLGGLIDPNQLGYAGDQSLD